MSRVKILGAPVDCMEMVDALCSIDNFVEDGSLHHIITLNAEILYKAQDDKNLLEIINAADMVTADGSGIVWAVEKLTGQKTGRVTGIDLMTEICRQSRKFGWKLFLFGAADGVAQTAAFNICRDFDADIIGTRNGYFNVMEESDIIDEINTAAPDILFVALGAPKQEEWINRNRNRLQVPVVIGVGGSFDVLAGNIKRAPKMFQKLGIEWMWRLLRQPSRIFRMMALPKFTLLVRRTYHKQQKQKQANRMNQ